MAKLPFRGVFGGAAGAGPRRIATIGAVVAGALGVSAVVLLAEHHHAATTVVGAAPHANALPGGQHSNPEYERNAREQAQFENDRAQRGGNSYIAPIEGHVETPAAAQDPTLAALAARPVPVVAHASTAPNPFVDATPVRAMPVATVPQAQKVDPNQVKVYGAAMRGLFASMGAVEPAVEVVQAPSSASSGQTASDGSDVHQAAARSPLSGSSSGDPTMARRLPGRLLVGAGKAVYGMNKLAVSSDQGGPVVVTAESGPIAGAEMIGSFQTKGNRLVVVLQSIKLPNGQQKKITALVIAPDSMETSVATSVDQHYVARFALPVAAAFVSGLGQAIAQSDTYSQASGLGGVTSYTHLNTAKIMGVAAGSAGQQAGQILNKMAPAGPTVNLAAGANVGVLFLEDLTDDTP